MSARPRARSRTPDGALRENWFHAGLDRAGADKALLATGAEGGFLVRDSASCPGDFVLSVLTAGEVIHYQIRRRGHDALFSLQSRQP